MTGNKSKLLIHLKSGQTIKVMCTDWEVTHAGGKPSGVSWKSADKRVFLDMEQVAAIEVENP